METEVKTELKQGFKPDNQARKLLNQYFDVCAYVYPDGVMIREKRTIKQGKYQSQLEIFHVYPCEIKLIKTNYRDTDSRPIARVVCHNPTTLLDGIKQFEYYTNNASTAMEKRGMTCNTLTITTLSGAKHRSDDWSELLGSEYTVQFDNEYTMTQIIEIEKNHGSLIEYHK